MNKLPIIISIIALALFAAMPTMQGKDKKKTPTVFTAKVSRDKKVRTAATIKGGNKNPKVAGRALAILLNEYSTMGDTVARELSARYRKSPAMQTEIARAYFRNNDRENTRLYLDKAMAIDKNYSPAYHLKGLSFGTYDKEKQMYVLIPSEADSACYWFNRSIAADSLNPEPYLDYADAMSWKNMPLALAKLETLRKAIPSYNVDLAIAELYEKKVKRSSTADEAAAARAAADSVVTKLDPRKLSSNQLAKFAMASYWASNTEQAEKLALIGTEKFPQNKDYNRVVGWAAARNGHYDTALTYLNRYYALVPKDSIDKLDLRSMDYLSYGIADLNLEHYYQAVEDFRKALATNDDYTSQMPMQINSAYNGKFRKLIADRKYNDAYTLYPQYIETVDKKDKPEKWEYMFDQYASKIDEGSEEEKKTILTCLDKIAETVGSKYADYENLPRMYYYTMVYTQQILDPESTEGSAVTTAQQLLSLLGSKSASDLKEKEHTYASTACNIIAFYEFKGNNNTPAATRYWQKALYYNPDDTQARSILTQLHALPTTTSKTNTKATKSKKKRK